MGHMTAPRIRRATRDDLPAITALQHAAYAQNRVLLGVEPLPLQADYNDIFNRMDCWIVGEGNEPEGVLILDLRPDDLLIWSIATAPHTRGSGVGNALLAFADDRAREAGRSIVRLYTGERLTANVAWYARHGFVVERIEQMPDRRAVHMKKTLEEAQWQDGSQEKPPS